MQPSEVYLEFKMNQKNYLLPIIYVQEVLECHQLRPLPLDHPIIGGVINLRGMVIPILKSIHCEKNKVARLILIKAKEDLFAIQASLIKKIVLDQAQLQVIEQEEFITINDYPYQLLKIEDVLGDFHENQKTA